MVNFGPLAAEIRRRVLGIPPHFNGFHVLAALLHGTLAVGVSQTAALNRGYHLYPAGRPSRWALAHILAVCLLTTLRNNFQTDLHEIFRGGWQWAIEQMVKF